VQEARLIGQSEPKRASGQDGLCLEPWDAQGCASISDKRLGFTVELKAAQALGRVSTEENFGQSPGADSEGRSQDEPIELERFEQFQSILKDKLQFRMERSEPESHALAMLRPKQKGVSEPCA
jgi:hypothetical protein